MRSRAFTMLIVALVASVLLGATVSTIMAKPPYPATDKCINGDVWFCYIWQFNPIVECCTNTYAYCGSSDWYFWNDGGVLYLCPYAGGDCHIAACP